MSTFAYSGAYSMRLKASNNSTTPADLVATTTVGSSGVAVSPGATYTGSIRVRSGSSVLRTARCELRWYTSAGAVLSTTSGTAESEVAGSWKSVTCSGVAPSGAARTALRVRVSGVGQNEAHYADDAWLVTAATTTTTTAPAPAFTYRTAAGSSTGVTTPTGVTFAADRDYLGGSAWGPSDSPIGGTDADALYQNNRWGMAGYAMAVPASATYTVRLHFAEVVMGSPGRRVFDVLAEGAVRLDDLDVYARVGPAQSLVEQFTVTVTDGVLNLGFQAVVEDPMISGIEVLSSGASTTPTTTAPSTTTTIAKTTTTTAPAPTTTTAPAPTTTTTIPTTTPVPSGSMPTASNTGPLTEPTQTITSDQAVAARGASNKIISGGIFVQDWGGSYLGTTWNFTDCVMKGTFYFLIDNGSASYPLSQYPTINITRCRIEGSFVFIGAARVNIDDTYVTLGAGMITPCPDCAGTTYGLVREMPWMVTNSLFRSLPGNPAIGEHTEAMHIAGTGQGFQFVNTRFVQEGPVNGTQTGALFMHAGRSTFDGCYFDDGDQGVSNAYYYTVYAYGTGPGATQNVFKNSAIEKGMASYVYPSQANDPVIHATYTNNRDFHSGAALTLP
ncbi:MAG: malectin [Actinomycetota bacterium]|nr:malectin [Actinomycetota bacterium]